MNYIKKFGAPKDMNESISTLIHAAPKLEVEELEKVRKMLENVMGKEFVE